jgi:type I restriction-modification system, M subunit
MSKNKTENKVLFIDASKEFKKETNNNILEDKNKLLKLYNIISWRCIIGIE